MLTTNVFKVKIALNTDTKYNFNLSLEGLRGICAIGVVFAHGLAQGWLDTTYSPSGIIPYFSFGSLAVYIFFMLSGYVIGLTILKTDNFKTTDFYKRRITRLYPIYLITFIFLIWLGTNTNIWQTIGNILMFQNSRDYFGIHIPVITNLAPIWSLNYEAVYYLIFPLILLYKPNFTLTVVFLLTLSVLGYYTNFPTFIADYSTGYLFWIIGLMLAWNLKGSNLNNYSIISYIFLFMASHHLSYGDIILKAAHLNSDKYYGLGLEILFFIPLCICAVADFAGKRLPYRKALLTFSYLLPALIFCYLIYNNRIFENNRWISCLIFYMLSLLTIRLHRFNNKILNVATKIGTISYALYVIHLPLMFTFRKYFPYNGPNWYWIKFTLWISLTVILSYLLEKKIQPKIVTFLKSKNVI